MIGGAIACFSMKNTSYPEYQVATKSGVMCLDFHPTEASLLAVGFALLRLGDMIPQCFYFSTFLSLLTPRIVASTMVLWGCMTCGPRASSRCTSRRPRPASTQIQCGRFIAPQHQFSSFVVSIECQCYSLYERSRNFRRCCGKQMTWTRTATSAP